MSVCKNLDKMYGGEWSYDRRQRCWVCSDGREVRRCVGLHDTSMVHYWMYEDGKEPVSVAISAEEAAKELFINAIHGHTEKGDFASAAEQLMCIITGDVKRAAALVRKAEV